MTGNLHYIMPLFVTSVWLETYITPCHYSCPAYDWKPTLHHATILDHRVVGNLHYTMPLFVTSVWLETYITPCHYSCPAYGWKPTLHHATIRVQRMIGNLHHATIRDQRMVGNLHYTMPLFVTSVWFETYIIPCHYS